MKVYPSSLFIAFLVWNFFNVFLCEVVTFEEFETPAGPWGRQPIYVDNNGAYWNILLAIHEEVEESTDLLENIKDTFTRASRLLFTATKERLYFGEISILLPDKWNSSVLFIEPRPNETFSTARIVIRDEGNDGLRPSVPYAKQLGGCGDESEMIYLPLRGLMSGNNSIYGDAAKVVVHLWGHLRWGLFNEFPSTPEDPPFYRSIRGDVKPSVCPPGLRGFVVSEEGGNLETNISECDLSPSANEGKCRFIVSTADGDVDQMSDDTASLMSFHFLDSVAQFCHSKLDGDIHSYHNHEAPTTHNRMCLQKSAWDVMLDSEDFSFKSEVKPPDVIPTFRFLHRLDKLSVVVLDARENMQENKKFERMITAYKEYVFTFFPTYSYLGVVSINETASQALPCLKLWERPGFRDQMFNNLPKRPSNSSGLGSALREALRILREIRLDISGSTIFVMSDGSDITSPTIDDVIPEVDSAGVTLATLPFSTDSSENVLLNNTIDKKFTSFLEKNDTLTSKRTKKYSTASLSDEDRFIRITKQKIRVEGNSLEVRSVTIDDAFNDQKMVVKVYWQHSQPMINLTDEYGDELFDIVKEYDDIKLVEMTSFNIQRCNMLVTLENNSTTPQNITFEVFVGVFVKSKENIYNTESVLIKARALLKSGVVNVTEEFYIPLYGVVSLYERPITDAVVHAVVTNKEGGQTILRLRDHGRDGDIQKLDGIYSAYFTNFSSEGNYTFELIVRTSADTSVRMDDFLPSAVASRILAFPVYKSEDLRDFERAPPSITFAATDVPADFQDSDYLPPSTITDLRLAHISPETDRWVTMTWTAPGDDFTNGQANSYDVRYGLSRSAIMKGFDVAKRVTTEMILVGTLTSPQASSKQEVLKLTLLSEKGAFFFFAVRAYDEVGNHGDISNILQVDLSEKDVIKWPKNTTDVYSLNTTWDPTLTVASYSDGSDINKGKNKDTSIIIYILVAIIGIISATCLLIGFRVVSKLKSSRTVSTSGLDKNEDSEMVIKQ